MTDLERDFEKQRQDIVYSLSWFRSRSNIAANEMIWNANEKRALRRVGGIIRDMERMVVRLREEWEKFLKMKRKDNEQSE